MDSVVQQNATHAEESASASEELSAQAEQLRDYVSDLEKLVTGHKEGNQEQLALSSNQKQLPRHTEKQSEKLLPFDEEVEKF